MQTVEEIDNICKEYSIVNYTINDDMLIDVDGFVDLAYCDLTELPLTFRYVKSYFNCSYNKLTTLKGAPIECEDFYCKINELTSYEYSPKKCNFFNSLCNTKIKSLYGLPLNLQKDNLWIGKRFTYDDYLNYCESVKKKLKV